MTYVDQLVQETEDHGGVGVVYSDSQYFDIVFSDEHVGIVVLVLKYRLDIFWVFNHIFVKVFVDILV